MRFWAKPKEDHKHEKTLLFLALCLSFTLWAESDFTLPDTAVSNTLTEGGFGEYRKFGFHVYDAKLWTRPNQNTPPYALQLKYFMDIKANKIVEASLKEMRGTSPCQNWSSITSPMTKTRAVWQSGVCRLLLITVNYFFV